MINPESQLRPRAGDAVQVDGREFVWRQYRSENELINTDAWLGEVPLGGSITYAVCHVWSEVEQTGLQMWVSDGPAKVYLNGRQVLKTLFGHAPRESGGTLVEDARLNRGPNLVLLKVVSTLGGAWGSLRLSDREGKPLKGIKVMVAPESPESKQ